MKEIEEAGVQVVTISYDSVETLKTFSDANDITFSMLSDEGSKTIEAYGIRNPEYAGRERVDGVPYPGTFIVEKDGKISAKVFLDGYRNRHTLEDLTEALKNLD